MPTYECRARIFDVEKSIEAETYAEAHDLMAELMWNHIDYEIEIAEIT
jgi:hypothetical protein